MANKKSVSLETLNKLVHGHEIIVLKYKNIELRATLWERYFSGYEFKQQLNGNHAWEKISSNMSYREAQQWWSERVPVGWFNN